MAVNLSPVGGVAAQFFTSTGAVLTGGKLYTYAAGTTTPQVTYTTSTGNVPWTNPVVLDAAGRVPGSGEIWLTDGIIYKFVLKDSNDVLIATYDNITGINPIINAETVVYDPPFTKSVATNVEAKLGRYVSVVDFGADPTGDADSTKFIQSAITYTLANGYKTLYFPAGVYKTSAPLTIATQGFNLIGDGALSTKIKPTAALTAPCIEMGDGTSVPRPSGNMVISGLFLDGSSTTNTNADGLYMFCSHLEVRDCIISEFAGHGINAYDSYSNKITHCRIYKCGKNGINLIQAPNIFEVSWNYILENANYGIYASGGNSLIIYGNDIEGTEYNAIRLIGNGTSAMRNVSLYDNYFENNSLDVGYPDAIYVDYGVGEITGLAVENNYFEGNGTINIQNINSAVVKNNVNGTLKVNFSGYNIFTENQQLGNYDVTGNNGQLSAYTNHNGTDGFTIEGRCTGIRLFTKEAGVESTVFSSKRAFPGDIGRSFMDGPLQMTPVAEASVSNNSLFIDNVTGKLTFKDFAGTPHPLY